MPVTTIGKNIFFDEISIPGNKQACASCHDPSTGWILPNSAINSTTVVAPGAAPHALGNIKPPSNAYAKFSPPFAFQSILPPNVPLPDVLVPISFRGGNFWDGRAEGYGATGAANPIGNPGAVSDTIRVGDLHLLDGTYEDAYKKYLGPTADQALNPFPNAVEQNIRKKNVCQRVKTAKYKNLYNQAFGQAIDCAGGLETSYKRIALALAAWQATGPDTDDPPNKGNVNQFSSIRDTKLNSNGRHFPLNDPPDLADLGHDLFYGRNDSGLNQASKAAGCNVCHNSGVPGSDGTEADQLYADHRYHHIGLPWNSQIPGVARGEKTGLTAHVPVARVSLTGLDHDVPIPPGHNKTPTLRNAAAPEGFIKAYGHNGYFKSLKNIVHFYNTSLVYTEGCEDANTDNRCDDDINATPDATSTAATWPGGPITRCASDDLSAAEAIEAKCWPKPEFEEATAQNAGVTGNLHLTSEEEDALVDYIEILTDQNPVVKP
jgi:cytochrome c peroxidase